MLCFTPTALCVASAGGLPQQGQHAACGWSPSPEGHAVGRCSAHGPGPFAATAAPQPAGAQPEPLRRGSFVHGMTPDVAFAFLNLGGIHAGAFPQPVTGPLQSSPACYHLPSTVTVGLVYPIALSADKDIKHSQRSGASTQLRPGLCASDGTAQCRAVQGALCPHAGLPNIQTSPNIFSKHASKQLLVSLAGRTLHVCLHVQFAGSGEGLGSFCTLAETLGSEKWQLHSICRRQATGSPRCTE